MMLVRAEKDTDKRAVRSVNVAAFESVAEAKLVDALREHASPIVSLVAEVNDAVVGHILFTPVTLSGRPDLKMMGLAPMAVTPEHQRQGIGSKLVRAGVAQCEQLACAAVVVLGHPDYYPRFGFSPSSCFGITSEYDVPEEAFMAMELRRGALHGISGVVKYDDAFRSL